MVDPAIQLIELVSQIQMLVRECVQTRRCRHAPRGWGEPVGDFHCHRQTTIVVILARPQIFGSERAAMCYHWFNRYGMLDSHALLQKRGRIGLQLHPTFAPGMKPISPPGGALLAIPSRNAERAAKSAWIAVETLTSPELMKYFILHGAAGNARHSVAEDRYVLQRNRVIAVMDRRAKAGGIQAFPCPATPRYHDLTRILSDHLQVLLFDGASDIHQGLGKLQDALATICQERVSKVDH